MRQVSRGKRAAPNALSRRNRSKLSELERARVHVAKGRHLKKAFPFAAYKDLEVRQRLEALFHGKCAYCESVYAATAPVDIEHYRPKGATEDGGVGYWWLAMAWDNLLPSCIDCNRRREQQLPDLSSSLLTLCPTTRRFNHSLSDLAGKGVSFPITGPRAAGEADDLEAEGALLLDPTRDTPCDHIAFNVARPGALALVHPQLYSASDTPPEPSLRGAVSIQTYGLNRLGLVQERTRIVRQLEFLEGVFDDITQVIADLDAAGAGAIPEVVFTKLERLQDRILGEMQRMALPTAPYSVVAKTWIADFKRRHGASPA